MKKWAILLPMILALGACVYAENPEGRFMAVDLPIHNQTTVHKTITVNAPAGTIVNISESHPPTVIYRDRPQRHCYFDKRLGQRVCVR